MGRGTCPWCATPASGAYRDGVRSSGDSGGTRTVGRRFDCAGGATWHHDGRQAQGVLLLRPRKARGRSRRVLNDMAKDGWRFVGLDAAPFLGSTSGTTLWLAAKSNRSARPIPAQAAGWSRSTRTTTGQARGGLGAAEQADEADEALGGTRTAS